MRVEWRGTSNWLDISWCWLWHRLRVFFDAWSPDRTFVLRPSRREFEAFDRVEWNDQWDVPRSEKEDRERHQSVSHWVSRTDIETSRDQWFDFHPIDIDAFDLVEIIQIGEIEMCLLLKRFIEIIHRSLMIDHLDSQILSTKMQWILLLREREREREKRDLLDSVAVSVVMSLDCRWSFDGHRREFLWSSQWIATSLHTLVEMEDSRWSFDAISWSRWSPPSKVNVIFPLLTRFVFTLKVNHRWWRRSSCSSIVRRS